MCWWIERPVCRWKCRRTGAEPWKRSASADPRFGVGVLIREHVDIFSGAADPVDHADALARSPDVAPCFRFVRSSGAELHRVETSCFEIVGIESGVDDRRAQIIA